MKVIISGAAGFIGGNLMQSLLKKNIECLGIDSFTDYYALGMKIKRVEELKIKDFIVNNSICDSTFVSDIFKEFEPTHVIHLAAQGGVRASKHNPLPYIESNQLGFLNILKASEHFRVKKFIYASSSSVYGEGSEAPFQESTNIFAPKSLYALSKLSNELIAKHLPLGQTQRIGLRLFTVYGPWGRPDMAIFRLLASAILEQPFDFTGNLSLVRDFTYVEDVVAVILELLNLSSPGIEPEIYNVAGGRPYSFFDLFNILEQMNIMVRLREREQDSLDVQLTHGSTEKLRRAGLSVPNTSLEIGLQKTWDWMQNQDKSQLRAWFDYSK